MKLDRRCESSDNKARNQLDERFVSPAISLRGRNTCSACGNVSRKNLAAVEEFDEDQLRLFSGHVHLAEVGSLKLTKMRTIELQGCFIVFSAVGFENDSQYARMPENGFEPR